MSESLELGMDEIKSAIDGLWCLPIFGFDESETPFA
jgi:hypothetical protein